MKKRQELYCYECLPPKPMKDHQLLKGIVIHERTDCPDGVLYMLNNSIFKMKEEK